MATYMRTCGCSASAGPVPRRISAVGARRSLQQSTAHALNPFLHKQVGRPALDSTALRVAHVDAARSIGEDGEERSVSSALASTSRRPLTTVGQSCLAAFGEAVKIAKAQNEAAVRQHHLLAALLTSCKLPFVTDVTQAAPPQFSKASHQESLGVAFGDCVAKLLQAATRYARQLGSAAVEAEHLLAALLDTPASQLNRIVAESGIPVDVPKLRTRLVAALQSFSAPQAFTTPAYCAVSAALSRSPSFGNGIVTTLQLLVGLLATDGAASSVLQEFQVTEGKLEAFMAEHLRNVLVPGTNSPAIPKDAFQTDGSILLQRLPCTPQAKLALQLALQSAAARGLGRVTSLDLLYGLLQAHTDAEQDWCDEALQHVGANPVEVMARIDSLLRSAPACTAEQEELIAPMHAWLQPNSYVWN